MAEENVAVLIDYENVGNQAHMRALMDELSGIGRITVKRAFGDWQKEDKKNQQQLQIPRYRADTSLANYIRKERQRHPADSGSHKSLTYIACTDRYFRDRVMRFGFLPLWSRFCVLMENLSTLRVAKIRRQMRSLTAAIALST